MALTITSMCMVLIDFTALTWYVDFLCGSALSCCGTCPSWASRQPPCSCSDAEYNLISIRPHLSSRPRRNSNVTIPSQRVHLSLGIWLAMVSRLAKMLSRYDQVIVLLVLAAQGKIGRLWDSFRSIHHSRDGSNHYPRPHQPKICPGRCFAAVRMHLPYSCNCCTIQAHTRGLSVWAAGLQWESVATLSHFRDCQGNCAHRANVACILSYFVAGGIYSQILLFSLFQGVDRSSEQIDYLLEICCPDHNHVGRTVALRDLHCLSSHRSIIRWVLLHVKSNFIDYVNLTQHLGTCLQGPGFKRTLVVGIVAKCLDIITDVLRWCSPTRHEPLR